MVLCIKLSVPVCHDTQWRLLPMVDYYLSVVPKTINESRRSILDGKCIGTNSLWLYF